MQHELLTFVLNSSCFSHAQNKSVFTSFKSVCVFTLACGFEAQLADGHKINIAQTHFEIKHFI